MENLEKLAKFLRKGGLTLSTAESCTGGGLGAVLTSLSGSSDYYYGGVITYADIAKERILGVPGHVLKEFGAVSADCAIAMAVGCRMLFNSSYSISITGIAGPGGGSSDKPVGTVFIGVSGPDGDKITLHAFTGSRSDIRRQSVEAAILRLISE